MTIVASETGPDRLADYREYLKGLARYRVTARLKPFLDPSDLVQITLLKAHEKFEQFRGATDAELRAWLRTILERNLADAARDFARRRPDRVVSLETARENASAFLEAFLAADGPGPAHAASHADRLVALARALDRLPADQRTALELRYLRGLSVPEIAAAMRRNTVPVTGLLYRGMKALRETLTDRP